MELRDETITVNTNLKRTDRECHVCGDGNFLRDGDELFCENCSYVPSRDERTESKEPWEIHREEIQLRANGDKEGRPRLPGGFADAYWGTGSYEYEPGEGLHL